MSMLLTNCRIIQETGILEGYAIQIENERISKIIPEDQITEFYAESTIDLKGRYVCPGFIDTHSDMVEQLVQPRPTSMLDFDLALKEGERQLVNQGITTMYHSLSLYQDTFGGVREIRKAKNVFRLAEAIQRCHNKSHLIHNRLHLRFDIHTIESLDAVQQLVEAGMVHQLSFMDHSPGQGQYRDLEIYRRSMKKGDLVTDEEFTQVLEFHETNEKIPFERLKELGKVAMRRGIPIASHDDDTIEKLDVVSELGCTISEFPITMEVATDAHRRGLYTVAGAPNVLLGGSHSGNLSATEAIKAGVVNILCSDYYPAALLHSVFLLHKKHQLPLHQVIALVTVNPARAMGISENYGSVEEGKMADLLVIDDSNTWPTITHVFIQGRMVSRLEYRL